MLISLKYNFVFLCTPKNASTSIEAMLRPYCEIAYLEHPALRHINYRNYTHYIEPFLTNEMHIDNLETICLVREPVSWLHSWYRFQHRVSLRNPNNPIHHKNTLGFTFSEFVSEYISPNPRPFATVKSQYGFVQDSDDVIGVDSIFAYEHLEDFIDYMSQKVGRKLSLNHLNSSPQKLFHSNILQLISHGFQVVKNKTPFKSILPPPNIPSLPPSLLEQLHIHSKNEFELHQKALNRQNTSDMQ